MQARFPECLAQVMMHLGSDDRIACIIHDEFMYFSQETAKDLKIPSIVLRTASAANFFARLGSIALMDAKELAKFEWGLANSQQPFLWVVRPNSVCSAKWIEVWKVGLELESELERGDIERVVRRVMVDEEGKEMQKRGKNLKERFKLCIREGGSSNNSLNELIDMIKSF
ncbi:hypothetical protein FH972_011606 [Carpinus fangiana]|uniref:Uncharacterized protein n=1 Tax=Carpinus fangiana TaxID=176857 RepID=A0A660KUW0_9ROSI|nr:hypothetical protein FH972_011606 [Carpinus fangiana]